jgi:hypothetical protein
MADEQQQRQSFFAKMAADFLVGTVESVVRAGAKAIESITSDAEKAVEKQRKKIAATREGVAEWRKNNVGEIDENDLT